MWKKLYSIPEAARVLGLSIPTVYRRLKDGSIPTVRLGPRRYVQSSFLEGLIGPTEKIPASFDLGQAQAEAAADRAHLRNSQEAD